MDADLNLTKNEGNLDRMVRAALGVALIAYPAIIGWPVWWLAVLAALGGAQLIASITGY